MKFRVLIVFTLALCLGVQAQESPYEMFGHESKVKYETLIAEFLIIRNSDTMATTEALAFNIEDGLVLFLDKNDSIIDYAVIEPDQIFRWLSTDPMAMERSWVSPYNFVQNSPLMRVDPNGALDDWVAEVDDNGETSYVAEEGDNLMTLKKQYNLTNQEVAKIGHESGFEISAVKNITKGTMISGSTVEKVTGNEVLKLDLKSTDLTDSDVINQVLFAMEHADVTMGWFAIDYFSGNDIINGDNAKFGTPYYSGYSSKFSDKSVAVNMFFNYKETSPIQKIPNSEHTWMVGHSGKYHIQLTTQTGKAYPEYPINISFMGEENMRKFSAKYKFDFSGTVK